MYKINPLQNSEFEFRRLIREQVEKSIATLDDPTLSLDERVHDFRTGLKKTRAVLRLMRFSLGEEAYAAENAYYRELQQKLAPLRDGTVRRVTMEKLLAEARDAFDIRRFDSYYRDLDTEYERLRGAFGTTNSDGQALESLREHAALIPPITDGSPATVVLGLKKIYKQGRKAMARAKADPSPENMHEWRKKTKYLWYHFKLLRETWRPVMGTLARALHQLSDDLGDEHDLSVLVGDLEKYPADEVFSAISTFAEDRKKSLRAEAFRLGEKVFLESPTAIRRTDDRLLGVGTQQGKPVKQNPTAPASASRRRKVIRDEG